MMKCRQGGRPERATGPNGVDQRQARIVARSRVAYPDRSLSSGIRATGVLVEFNVQTAVCHPGQLVRTGRLL